jgi:glycosyltransferase involved in cell wall biosynthesis
MGVDVTLVIPARWPEHGAEAALSEEAFRIVELGVRRAGDVNRHVYERNCDLPGLLAFVKPDVLDLHEEPVSRVAYQWLRAAGDLPVCMYTAQNIDKRFPPPFAQYEAVALRRADAVYPCSRQAAAVARGKGFSGLVEVLPLGVDSAYRAGDQALGSGEVRLGLIGRLVPEKGVRDAVQVLAAVRARRKARLLIVGDGPEAEPARRLAEELGVGADVEVLPWQTETMLAELYRTLHVVLVPSRATETWVEQFGRIIVEAQASGAVVAGYASGAIPEVGADAAVLVPEGQVDRLAGAVRAVLEDPQQYDRLRRRGLERAAQATWSAVAARQAELYERVATGTVPRRKLPRRADLRRTVAEEEFGPVATLVGGVRRPFALPVLRRDTAATRLLGRAVDLGSRMAGR